MRNNSKNCVENTTKVLCEKIYSNIRSTSHCPIYWFGIENFDCPIACVHGNTNWENSIIEKVNGNIVAILDNDIDVYINTICLIAEVGIKNAYDIKNKYRWNMPYSKDMILAIAEEIYRQYLIGKGNTKKCLVLDCDNVLWGGIISEGGLENIVLGEEGLGVMYREFQQFLLTLYYHGVILTVCSKNDIEDVQKVFREHDGMILKEEHIACFQVGWNNKVDGIKDIAKKLNIGLDSMVFVDDSAYEIESVKTCLPEVHTILYEDGESRINEELYRVIKGKYRKNR